jgi:hypothetical protein
VKELRRARVVSSVGAFSLFDISMVEMVRCLGVCMLMEVVECLRVVEERFFQ